jgi:hypothetical protein
MSVERAGEDYSDPRVPNLPPFNAWQFPEYWLNSADGRIKGTAKRIRPPVDDDGFIKVDELMDELLQSVFRPGFDWDFDPNDETTWPASFRFFEGQDRVMPEQMRNALYGIVARVPGQGIDRVANEFEMGTDRIGPVEQQFLDRHFPSYAIKLGTTAIDLKRPVDESPETIAAHVAPDGHVRQIISIEALRREVALIREDSHYFEHFAA